MMRFYREKRFFGTVGLEDFHDQAKKLEEVIGKVKQGLTFEVLTCEDAVVFNASNSTFSSPEHDEVLKLRRPYQLSELNDEVWDRSFKIEFLLRSTSQNDNFMIVLTHDRYYLSKILSFYAQCYDLAVEKLLKNPFQVHNLYWDVKLGHCFRPR